ncbi:site-specific integrase [Candidatus Bathyarchaeota archaeon]|nr:site-specific integrase [Candidatus Bathyarchaeota archaeon]
MNNSISGLDELAKNYPQLSIAPPPPPAPPTGSPKKGRKGKRGQRWKGAPGDVVLDALLRTAFYEFAIRVYLMLRIIIRTGIREAELVGQPPSLAYCRCHACRSKRSGTTPTSSGKAPKGCKHKACQEWRKSGIPPDHPRKPLPGLRPRDIDYSGKRIMIHGKGWANEASPGHAPEDQPIDPDTLAYLRDYIEVNKIPKEERLFPISTPEGSTRELQRIVKEVALKARLHQIPCPVYSIILNDKGERELRYDPKATCNCPPIPNADKISPHRLRAAFITQTYRKLKDLEKTRRLARHTKKSVSVTIGYIDLDKEDLQKDYEGIFKPDEDHNKSVP